MNTGNFRNKTTKIAVVGGIIVLIILVAGTIFMGRNAKRSTETAVRTVSLLYMDELAGRREQVVEANLDNRIRELQTAVNLMDESDLSDAEHLQSYQARMKQLFELEKFAFIDTEGTIYTASGIKHDVDAYAFDYRTITEPVISVLDLQSPDKKVDIAMPVELAFGDVSFIAAFMEIDMKEMLAGASIGSTSEEATFCNIYTKDGIALSNTVLGGLAVEDNLLNALENAEFEKGYSYDAFLEEFQEGRSGVVSFDYNGIRETLSYVPVKGTDWRVTYLIRENVISEKISSISRGIIRRSIVQSLLTVLALLVMFSFIISQSRKNAQMRLMHETQEAENRVKQEEMEHRIELQEKLLEEEKIRSQQDNMITAMASDYRSVYYVELDGDEAVCFRSDQNDPERIEEGAHFPYYERFARYGNEHVKEEYRDGFLRFINPENIIKGLEEEKILAYRYLAERSGKEYYEMIRAAGVRSFGEHAGTQVHAIGIGFTIIDAEMRDTMAQQQALANALTDAEFANKAKTAFLSSMSHEIRTPMNAIIGLDNIALNDPEATPRIRGYLEKIGSSAEHLLGLINDILDMSRIESGRMTLKNEEFSFAKLIEAINIMFSGQCQDKGIDYQCRIEGETDHYYIGDNMKLRQILINILGNAVKFTPEGGKVEFRVSQKAKFEGKTALCFEIEDTGIGMSPDFLPHLYDTFAQEDSSNTNRYGSSGLGLAITKNLVEMMNGTIEVESEKGKGTTFTVVVTLTDSQRASGNEGEEEIRPDELAVLVVDDDPTACEHAKIVLGKAGISSETASGGEEALEMINLRRARMKPYDLILADWKMPGMDGIELTRQIRQMSGHESTVIILTAYRWDDVLSEAMEAGVDSFIQKPLFAASVLEEFRSAMKRKSGELEKESRKADLKGRRILLAEDVKVNAEIMIMVLGMREMEADLAENGRIAVEKFAEHEIGYYDAVLMDMRMPEMDGLEATKAIRAMDRSDAKEIPIIALTANAFDEDVQRSLQAGLNAHLSKPVQPEALYETLENLIRN